MWCCDIYSITELILNIRILYVKGSMTISGVGLDKIANLSNERTKQK